MRRVLTTMTAAAVLMLTTAGAAQAQVVTLTANLSGANETPAPGVLTGAFGTATVTWNQTTQTLTWIIDIWNMPSGTSNAHFHVGGPGVAGPTVVNIAFPANISNDYRLTGSATSANLNVRAEQGIRSWDDFGQSLLGGQIYINIHSNNNPGGEVRGQVIRTP
ncbi:MAG TPA: CHRD domain-containing protein [Vicinamibacterales bacterium]|nr:CHRD domain-containing protein [Vicinamibacterales bacterium]